MDINRIANITEGFSGADVSAVINTAISIVLHEYLQKYPNPNETAKHVSDAVASSKHFEDVVKKIKTQSDMKPAERTALSQYR